MPRCFVIQPFDDGGAFDKRYDQVVAPAILAAGFEPYRVDRDSSADNLNEQIEGGIRRADACFADITADNPNVWFEVGFAIALGKPVVLICSSVRTRYPFDVHHRPVIRYRLESPMDFHELERKITKHLQERCALSSKSGPISLEMLTENHRRVLSVIARNPDAMDHGTSIVQIQELLGEVALTESLDGLIAALLGQRMIDAHPNADPAEAHVYTASRAGFDWLAAPRPQDLQGVGQRSSRPF